MLGEVAQEPQNKATKAPRKKDGFTDWFVLRDEERASAECERLEKFWSIKPGDSKICLSRATRGWKLIECGNKGPLVVLISCGVQPDKKRIEIHKAMDGAVLRTVD